MVSFPEYILCGKNERVFQVGQDTKCTIPEKTVPPLAEIVKTQPVFELKNITGTMVGFWCPPFVKGINVPGYHLHFITSDGKAGGHVLDFVVADVTAEFDDTRELFLILPNDNDFDKVDLARDRATELKAVEKENR